jgi:hypothetical protein
MSTLMFIIISSAGIGSLLMPSSPVGVLTSFSLSQYEEAIFYNPAHFEASENFKLSCFYNHFYLGMRSFSFALSKRVKSFDLGLAINNFDYGEMELRPNYPTEDPVAHYTANDLSIMLSGRVKVSSEGKIGVNVKYIYEQVYTYSGYAFACDLAFAYGNPKNGITFGASNFGTRVMLKNEEVNLPARLSIGGYHSFGKVVASTDVHYLINNAETEFGIGVTIPVHTLITLSAAMNYRENLYPGFGVTITPGGWTIKYGAALYPKNLGMVNILGIGFGF